MSSPLSVSFDHDPRLAPGLSCSPHSRDFAQPIVGTPRTSPRWLAMPNRRGWAMPWPSTMMTSGFVVIFFHAESSGGISRNESSPGM